MSKPELQPLPEGYDPADYIAVKMLGVEPSRTIQIRTGHGSVEYCLPSHAFALPVPAPTPPAWADAPPEGVWHATGQAIIDNNLEWGYSPDEVDSRFQQNVHPTRDYYAREPQRRTAATILDEIGRRFVNPVASELLAEYRAALTAEDTP